jgi:hypothetical protein
VGLHNVLEDVQRVSLINIYIAVTGEDREHEVISQRNLPGRLLEDAFRKFISHNFKGHCA